MKVLSLFLPVLLLCSCSSSSDKETEKAGPSVPQATIVTSLKDEAQIDARVSEIDTLLARDGVMISTLNYSKPDQGESYQAHGYTDSKGTLLKVKEFFNDGNGKNNGTRTFYLNNGQAFYSREQVATVSDEYYDRVSYYSPEGKVLKTKERKAGYEEAAEQMQYQAVGLAKADVSRAMQALNQKGEFATTFQGFVYQEALTYLVVGENTPDGFTSAIKCDFKDELISALSKNEKKYIGHPLKVNFQEYTDQDGLTTQLYLGGTFAK